MSDEDDSEIASALALELFQPYPDVLYSLEATAHLARVPRRSILIYCRAGLVRPVRTKGRLRLGVRAAEHQAAARPRPSVALRGDR